MHSQRGDRRASGGGAGPTRRQAAGLVLCGALLALAATPPVRSLASLPYRVRLVPGEVHELASKLPVRLYVRSDSGKALRINGRLASSGRWLAADRLAVEAPGVGRYRLELRALKVIPIRRVTVDAVQPIAVVPGGESIGVLVDAGGVVIVEEWPVVDGAGRKQYPAREAGLQAGDVIVAVDGRRVRNRDEVADLIQSAGERGAILPLVFRRDGREMETSIQPVYDAEKRRYLMGLWVRDGATGIGTMTFYEPVSARFGALGHLVADPSGAPYRFTSGAVIDAFISGIRPGKAGEPGEKIGVFLNQDDHLGEIDRNTVLGIFGRLNRLPKSPGVVPVALEGEVHAGPAQVVTVVRGQQPEVFEATIERVFPQGRPSDKGMIVRITDPRLLAVTGGIVQGMSGSPILQDGKLAGAVTHVFVNDPTRGYGVFAEWMVREGLPQELPEAAGM